MNSIALFAVICGLLAAISWGLADFFASKASRRTSPEATALWGSIIGVLVYTIIFMFNKGGAGWPVEAIVYAIASGACFEIGILAFYRALEIGPVSLVSPLASAYPIITTLILVFIFKSSLSLIEGSGIGIVVLGILLTTGLIDTITTQKKITLGVVYSFAAFLLWGGAYAFLGQSVLKFGWQKSILLNVWAGLLTLIVLLILTKGRKIVTYFKDKSYSDRYVVLVALIGLFGGIIFGIGLKHSSSTAVITAISATYPALTILLALKYLGEKKRIWPLLGSFIIIVGVVVLST